MKSHILGPDEFRQDVEKIMSLMPRNNDEDLLAYDYMKGILNQILVTEQDADEVKKLITYLDEKDRRRGTDWQSVFPWLTKYKNVV